METAFIRRPLFMIFLLHLNAGLSTLGSLNTNSVMFNTLPCNTITTAHGTSIGLVPKAVTDRQLPEIGRIGAANSVVCKLPACLSEPCLNGGNCVETHLGFACNCAQDYYGVQCENRYCSDTFSHFRGNCYIYVRTTQDFSTALSYCRAAGENVDLASVHSTEELDFMTSLCEAHSDCTYSQWIGLNRTSYSVPFGWTDGTPFNYTAWGNDEPSSNGSYFWAELCVEMIFPGVKTMNATNPRDSHIEHAQWNTKYCKGYYISYACKFPLD
ncbi:brevican core protein-like [Lytechinus pictus]|uniref:brevican core protein-like n=1 Tax=Lytechinus pictus TaxID=7653 RepID=UPI0030B9C69B